MFRAFTKYRNSGAHLDKNSRKIITFSEHIKYTISSINNKIYFDFLLFLVFMFLSHIIIITFEQCAELTVAITITHRNVTDTTWHAENVNSADPFN